MRKIVFILFIIATSLGYSQAPTAGELVAIHSATLAEINAIVDPYEGSLIYNSDDSFLYQYTGNAWQKLTPEGNETKIISDGNVTISGTGTTADPYIVSSIKPTFTTNPDGSFTFSNGVDPDVNFFPTVPGNSPIVSNSDAGTGNCSQFGLNETKNVIIQGAYFDGSSTVAITGQTVNSVVINSSSQITANVTSGSSYGNYDISVANNAGSSTLTGGFVLQAASSLTTNGIAITDMILTGSMNYNGMQLTKTATAGWNAQGYSTAQSIDPTIGGHLDWTADQSNKYVMIGLSTTPHTSASYTNLDYAMYMVTNSNIQIRENGASLGYVSGYSAGDRLSINIDCLGNVTYLRNDIVIFSSSKKATNPLYFDSSFHSVDASISNITMTH
ncbi:hypothetical protein [Maribacter sp.]|uniref:hypothetical protein n=1 Tax=Maribacter sp. TaxID=1897614 RepID=UPI0025BD405D|nr:hypothetical protein [Maribacter sp.]